jgi:hypothetical protein
LWGYVACFWDFLLYVSCGKNDGKFGVKMRRGARGAPFWLFFAVCLLFVFFQNGGKWKTLVEKPNFVE